MQKSIVLTISGYSLVQIGLIAIFAHLDNAQLSLFAFYALFTIILHVILALFLLHFRHFFSDHITGKPMTRINAANLITLMRISSVPAIAFLLRKSDTAEIKIILPVILALVFLTDTFDGQIARKRHQITRIGQMLDSISDYCLLAVISVAYLQNDIVSAWFFVLIFLRLFLQAFGMLIFLILRRPVEAKSTWGGKIAIATTMSLYLLELIRLYLPASLTAAFQYLEYAAGAIVFLSFFEKAFIFFRHSKNTGKPKGR